MDFYILSFLCFHSPPPRKKSAAGVTFIGGTDRNGIPSPLYKAVIEYHIYYFPIHKAASVASISRALSDFISSAWDDLYSSAPLLSAKSAFVSLGTLRTFKLITLSTFGCLCPPSTLSPQLQPHSAPPSPMDNDISSLGPSPEGWKWSAVVGRTNLFPFPSVSDCLWELIIFKWIRQDAWRDGLIWSFVKSH